MYAKDPLNTVIALSSEFTPTAIRVAATLRIPDLIEAGHDTAAELAERAGCDEQALTRLMRYLCLLGLFEITAQGRFEVTETGRCIGANHPGSLRPWLDLENPGRQIEARFEPAIGELLTAVRTGAPVYEKVYGRDYWEDLAAQPELDKAFNDALTRTVEALVPELLSSYDWAGVDRVVDVGGGNGALLAPLLAKFSSLHGTLFDLPHVVEQGAETLAPFAGRCELVGGSFFDEVPEGADVYLIANTLHNWSDADAERILRSCVAAARPGSRVLVVERLVDTDKDPMMASYADLLMLVLLGARERTEGDFRQLCAGVGLEPGSTVRFDTPGMWLLEFTLAN